MKNRSARSRHGRALTRRQYLRPVKYFAWDDAKNAKLRADRGIGFEDIVFNIERGDLLEILELPFAPSPVSWRRGYGEVSP